MKRSVLLTLTACLSFAGLFAQGSNIIVFSDAGEKFTLLVDGEAKNTEPATRVVAKDIRNQSPLMVVNFQDASIPSLKQGGYLEPGLEYTIRITMNKKGVRVMRMQGQAPIGIAAAPLGDKPAPANFRDDAPGEVIATDPASGQTVRQTTTVTTTGGTADGRVDVNMGVNGVGVNMSVNDGMGGITTTTTTTTTTISNPAVQTVEEAPAIPAGCGQAMSDADFNEALASISGQGFEENKLTLAKQIGSSNCLSTAQVKAVMGAFGFEDSKLDFAKFAYDHVSDRNNYYKVNDAFGFSSSVEELNKYMQSR